MRIRGYLLSQSYSTRLGTDTRKYGQFRVGLGDGTGSRRPNDFGSGEGRI